MRAVAVVLMLVGCSHARPPTPDDVEDDTPATPTTPHGDATVLFLDSAGRAVPLACAAPGVGLYPDPEPCVELLGDDRTIGDLGSGRRTLGEESPWICAGNDTRRRAYRIDAAPGRKYADGDPANDLIVWPAARGFDVRVWTRESDPTPPEVKLAARWAEVATTVHGAATARPEDARLIGTLAVDLDRDGQDDLLFSLGPLGDGPHVVLGALTSRPGELVELLSDAVGAVQAYAALDLDGDGAPEIVVSAPTADGDWTAVYQYRGGTLASFSGVGC